MSSWKQAAELMASFVDRTGVTSEHAPRRYLWTDAFAVYNLLALAHATGDARHRDLALRLVHQVHQVLGRHRPDDRRVGWLSGLDGGEAEAHPTRGGLRIGKPLPERASGEPLDDALEWDRDGQYFHYLTRWMHALDQTSRHTRDPRYNLWARELAAVAHAAFAHGPPRARRLFWKMSIDLSRPLVPSMGQHDALDGLITYAQLGVTASLLGSGGDGPDLSRPIADFAAITVGDDWSTADPLGLGGLLTDAFRVQQLMAEGSFSSGEVLEDLLSSAVRSLPAYIGRGELREAPSTRLAFRELGLAIGLHAIERAQRSSSTGRIGHLVAALASYVPLAATIESCWLDPRQRDTQPWREHIDIDEVMLATSLLPDGFLVLTPVS